MWVLLAWNRTWRATALDHSPEPPPCATAPGLRSLPVPPCCALLQHLPTSGLRGAVCDPGWRSRCQPPGPLPRREQVHSPAPFSHPLWPHATLDAFSLPAQCQACAPPSASRVPSSLLREQHRCQRPSVSGSPAFLKPDRLLGIWNPRPWIWAVTIL